MTSVLTTQAATEDVTGAPPRPAAAAGPLVVDLADPRAHDAALVGAKAAALARATAAGLPALPGFVLTTAATAGPGPVERSAVEPAWRRLSGDGERVLVVRSSSTVEDGESTSMAGMFTSVLDVRGWAAFDAAVRRVLSSMKAVPGVEAAPMAVLVQPQLDARVGGVMFGADPVSGRTDRLVVAAAEGAPEKLVSGIVDGAQYVLSRRGRSLGAERPMPGLGRSDLRALARLAARVAHVFGGPQDVEWAVDHEGRLRLLQSRPITTVTARAPTGTGPLLAPGPVAETFPDRLSPLEEDLWLAPLRTGLSEALLLTGAASRRQVAGSPVVTTVGGWAAADLGLLGGAPVRRRLLARLDPRGPARRLVASWRVGRLGAALPGLVVDLLDDVDAQLLGVPPLAELDSRQLVELLRRAGQALVALNGHEVLAGLLVAPGATGATGASVALRALAEGREAGADDAEIATHRPVVLALVPPRVGPPPTLPATPAAAHPALAVDDAGDEAALLREALRLRVRWVQELGARAAWELGRRLAGAGTLPDPGAVAFLRLDELDDARQGRVPEDLAERRRRSALPPLPAAFRLSGEGTVVAERHGDAGEGRGAGGGRGTGPVHQGDGLPEQGAVLVVRNLDPGLAAVLPRLGGLVAETGSVLSHLAILAREFGVPTVVAVPDALARFPAGATVVVDGATGEVALAERPGLGPPPGEHRADVIDLRSRAAARTSEGGLA